jgi:hypothetical protein
VAIADSWRRKGPGGVSLRSDHFSNLAWPTGKQMLYEKII